MTLLHELKEDALFPADVVMQQLADVFEQGGVIGSGWGIALDAGSEAAQDVVFAEQLVAYFDLVDEVQQQAFFIVKVMGNFGMPGVEEFFDDAAAVLRRAGSGAFEVASDDKAVHMLA